MQLWYAPTSPFARKVRIAAGELGLSDRIELVEVNPWTDERLRRLNPLGKVPTLVTDTGAVLFESAVICEYLDSLGPRARLFPSGEARFRALLLQGLADGASTAAGRLFADERRPENERSAAVMARLSQAIESTLDALERESLASDPLTIGEVSAAALLGYLDFRWPERSFRGERPRLSAWFEIVNQRPSLRATEHHLPGG
ncbi:MAG: glutathione S-transferase N-terminal domain-containing protein [Minicystis sp.]